MKKSICISDLKSQPARIIRSLAESNEPIFIIQDGQPTAVLLSVEAFVQIEADLIRLDELEMLYLVQPGLDDFSQGRTFTQQEARERLQNRSIGLHQ